MLSKYSLKENLFKYEIPNLRRGEQKVVLRVSKVVLRVCSHNNIIVNGEPTKFLIINLRITTLGAEEPVVLVKVSFCNSFFYSHQI